MFRKIIIVFCTLLFVIPAINTLNIESTVCASGYQEAKNVVGLNSSFIESMATAMSNIIYTQYSPSGEIPKGRWFGTKGEWKARDFIEENFTKWGISFDRERIEKTSNYFKSNYVDKVEEILSVQYMNLSYYYPPSGETKYIKNFHMTPSWGFSGTLGLLLAGSDRIKELPLVYRVVYALYSLWSKLALTSNITYSNLKLYDRPNSFVEDIIECIEDCLDDVKIWLKGDISYAELLNRVMNEMQSEYDFSFEGIVLNHNKAKALPWYDATIDGCSNNFLFIGEDLLFNPDKESVKPSI